MLTTHKYYRSNLATQRGYTLVELLVVVMIVLILIAAALPVAKNVMESNRTREASRQLNTHLAMARAYASRNNRPFGLWMEMDAAIGDATVSASDADLPGRGAAAVFRRHDVVAGDHPHSAGTVARPSSAATVPPRIPSPNGEVDPDTSERRVPAESDRRRRGVHREVRF